MSSPIEYVRQLAQEEADSGHAENAAVLHGLLALREHILAMANDAYLVGHPEWVEIVNEAKEEPCTVPRWTVLGYFGDDEAVFAFEVEAPDMVAAVRQAALEHSGGHCIPFHQAANNMMVVDIVAGWGGAVGDFERVMSAADLLPD